MIKRRWLRALPLAGLIIVGGVTSAQAASSTPTVKAAQASGSMFDTGDDTYCKPSAPLPNRNASSPGVTKDSITLIDVSTDYNVIKRLGLDVPDNAANFKTFVNEINKCGGINGRKLIYKRFGYNGLASDINGHIQAMCLKATEDVKAFVVIQQGAPQSTGLQRCVSVLHKTIMVAPTNTSAADFADSKGRIVSLYSAGDKAASSLISALLDERALQGRKVGIVGSNTSSTAPADQKAQYADYLAKQGIEPADFEILACPSGTNCSVSAPLAVRKLKAAGVQVLIFTQNINQTTFAGLFREIQSQHLDVPIYFAYTGAIQSEAVQATGVRAAGADAMSYVANNGAFALQTQEIYNGWRIGEAKPTKLALTCNRIAAQDQGYKAYEFGEKDIASGKFNGPPDACIQLRQVGRAIESLGANVTTERMVEALKKIKDVDHVYQHKNTVDFSSRVFYSDRFVTPQKGMWLRLNYPCPSPARTTSSCWLPKDRPPVVRPINIR